MNDIDISINIFAAIDDVIKSIEIAPRPGPAGLLNESEIFNGFTSNIKTLVLVL